MPVSSLPFAAKVVISIVVMEILGGLGAFVTVDSIPDWYAGLLKPVGTPPNSVFGPVWTLLYALIGISFAIIWHSRVTGEVRKKAFTWFWIQLILNLAWTPIFFGSHMMGVALIVIIALFVSIVMTMLSFKKISSKACWLLLPYLLWVGYATYLNAGYLMLNP